MALPEQRLESISFAQFQKLMPSPAELGEAEVHIDLLESKEQSEFSLARITFCFEGSALGKCASSMQTSNLRIGSLKILFCLHGGSLSPHDLRSRLQPPDQVVIKPFRPSGLQAGAASQDCNHPYCICPGSLHYSWYFCCYHVLQLLLYL